MASNMTFLLESHRELRLPGMLNLQKSQWADRSHDRRASGPTNPHIWADRVGKEAPSLSSEWESAAEEVIEVLTPLAPARGKGVIQGVMLGDELVCGHFALSNLSALALKLHSALAPTGLFIYTNECFREGFPCQDDDDCARNNQGSGAGPATCTAGSCHAAVWPEIPLGLDYISLDVYAPGQGAAEATLAKQYANTFFFPLLKPHQSIWLVPGMFGRNNTKGPSSSPPSFRFSSVS